MFDLTDKGHPKRFPLLITGHPRSGTGYMAAICRASGFDVGHESMGGHGISSWLMGPPAWRVCFHRYWESLGRNWFAFDRTIEVVRDPLPLIASVAFTENRGEEEQAMSLQWRAAWCPIDLEADTVVQAVQSIVGWHRMVRQWLPGSTVMRLEDARRDLPRFLGVEPPPDPGVVNARPHDALGWDDIERRIGPRLWKALDDHRQELGYL